ncbi:hypothetical protein GCM10010399_63000 [Dactylosporangium fulvum]
MARGARTAAAAVLMSGALVTTGVLATASPAAAAPSSCHIGKGWNVPGYVWYRCDSGSGYYRAMAYCSNTPGGWGLYVWGPWRGTSSGLPSQANCPSSHPYLVDGLGERK